MLKKKKKVFLYRIQYLVNTFLLLLVVEYRVKSRTVDIYKLNYFLFLFLNTRWEQLKKNNNNKKLPFIRLKKKSNNNNHANVWNEHLITNTHGHYWKDNNNTDFRKSILNYYSIIPINYRILWFYKSDTYALFER